MFLLLPVQFLFDNSEKKKKINQTPESFFQLPGKVT